jgi:hypothetical protein
LLKGHREEKLAMRKPFLLLILLVVSLFVLMWGYGAFVAPYSGGGWWGMMGPNMMAGPGMWGGPGMIGGYGPGVKGPGWNTGWRDLKASTDNVNNYFDRWLAWQGNPRLKIGDVKEKDADTVVIDIVTKDNSLVQRFVVNRHNGYFQPSEE